MVDAPIISVDTETSGIEGIKSGADYCMGISVTYKLPVIGKISGYFPYRHHEGNLDRTRTLPALDHILSSRPLVFHNRKFDLHSLKTLGVELDRTKNIQYDTMVMAHLVDEELFSKELDWLSKRFLNDQKDKSELEKWVRLVGWANVPVEVMTPYACHDTELTYDLFELFYKEMQDQELLDLWPVEQEYTNVLYRMEQEAIKLNVPYIEKKLEIAETTLAELESILSFNPRSSKQLGEFLIDQLGLPVVRRTKTGAASFNKEAMFEYDELLSLQNSPLAKLILTYRGWATFVSLFCEPMMKYKTPQNYIHTEYRQTGTVTGRLSSEKPNLQQIPRQSENEWNGDAKQAFEAEEGFELIGFDYSQLEFRLAIAYGGDQFYLDIFNDPDSDVFQSMAERLVLKRQTCKHSTYCMLFGGGKPKLFATIAKFEGLSHADESMCEAHYNTFKNSMPGVNAAFKRATYLAEQKGYVRLWTGRRRHFKYNHYRAFNSLLQGGAAELVKRSQIRCSKFEDQNCRMVLQVHDEIVFKIRKGMRHIYEPLIIEAMTNWPDFGVLLKVEGKVWNI